jgi:putative transposase
MGAAAVDREAISGKTAQEARGWQDATLYRCGVGRDSGGQLMSKVYSELFYHFVWATRGREPLIHPEMEPTLFRQIRSKCAEVRIQVHALNGMPDHVHLACTVPTSLSIGDAMERVKGASAHFINHLEQDGWRLNWQEGYGALTFAKRDLPRIVAYIDGQKVHHAAGSIHGKMERLSDDG